ncbi:hypothetical protein SCA6_004465 [Theobroma cacao]
MSTILISDQRLYDWPLKQQLKIVTPEILSPVWLHGALVGPMKNQEIPLRKQRKRCYSKSCGHSSEGTG